LEAATERRKKKKKRKRGVQSKGNEWRRKEEKEKEKEMAVWCFFCSFRPIVYSTDCYQTGITLE